jgi:hypothetical protein
LHALQSNASAIRPVLLRLQSKAAIALESAMTISGAITPPAWWVSQPQAGEGGRQRAQEDPQQNKQQLMTGEPVTDNMGPPA